ncbi:hypothetical protein AVEN_115285-1 [Araneus ventricosus]|uniref:Uncharacterized protein n=1 Tax=Araneus ventricosus TaxID=182803 RepID=A0A4Y1ZYS4_ARAVE|nr:hypothetical protein AVEN_115285-1 [Araneus ventricosus]
MLFRTLSPTTVPNFKTTPFFFSIRRFLAFVDWTIKSHFEVTPELFGTDFVILNIGQMTRTSPELAPLSKLPHHTSGRALGKSCCLANAVCELAFCD